jgi:hypothetical protein
MAPSRRALRRRGGCQWGFVSVSVLLAQLGDELRRSEDRQDAAHAEDVLVAGDQERPPVDGQVIAVIRAAGDAPDGVRPRAVIVVLCLRGVRVFEEIEALGLELFEFRQIPAGPRSRWCGDDVSAEPW